MYAREMDFKSARDAPDFSLAAIFSAVEAKYGAKMLAFGNYLAHPLDRLSLGSALPSASLGSRMF